MICLVAVDDAGTCYVDCSGLGDSYVNIDLLIYDTSECTGDRLQYYAKYYYEVLYNTSGDNCTFAIYDADYYYNDRHMTIFTVSNDGEPICNIGVTDDGVGYVDYSCEALEFTKII